MSSAIDRLYVNFVSSRLERFRWIRSHVAVCKCPLCGDGKKGTKTRFYIYQDVKYSSDKYNTECKNCGHASSFYTFLKDFDPGLFRDYRLDNFREKYGREPREMFQETAVEAKPVESKLDSQHLDHCKLLSELPNDHRCVLYVKSRQIPDQFMNYLMFTDNFQAMSAAFKDDEYAKKMPSDKRLIIPFYTEFGELLCYQGRSLDPNSKMRYISVKKHDAVVKTFGMDRIDRSKEVRVCEGPLDSLFISNALAAADADLTRVKGDTYIFDAQYRNKDICNRINKAIEANFKVVLFPSTFIYKDINECVTDGGFTLGQIETLIKENTYSGLKAKLVFSKLRGC